MIRQTFKQILAAARREIPVLARAGAESATRTGEAAAGTLARDSVKISERAALARRVLTRGEGLAPKKVMSGKEVVTMLKSHGFEHVRTEGSHHIMVRGGVTVPVPVHGNDDLGKGLLNAILKQAGLK